MEEDIRENILRVLPTLQPDTLDSLLRTLLEDVGVEGLDDLQLVTREDFGDLLKPIQVRKLLSAWKAGSDFQLVLDK